MPLRLSAFPKCYIDQIAGDRTMSVFDWIEHGPLARRRRAGNVRRLLHRVSTTPTSTASARRFAAAGFAMPMLCCSPDFTNPDPDARKRAIDREASMIRIARRLGGPGAVCRVLSGQRYPEVEPRPGACNGSSSASSRCCRSRREHDVVLGLENHYKDGFWTYPEFAQKQDVFLALLERHPRPRRTSACSTTLRTRSSPATTRSRSFAPWPIASSACTPATATWPRGRPWTSCARPTARSAIRRTCATASPARG